MENNQVATMSDGRETNANQYDNSQSLLTPQVLNVPSPAMSPLPHTQLATAPRISRHPNPSHGGSVSSVLQSILAVPQSSAKVMPATSLHSVRTPPDSGGHYVTGAQLLEQRHPAHLQESPYLRVPRPTIVPSNPHPNHPANDFHPQHGSPSPVVNGTYVPPRHTPSDPCPVSSVPSHIPQNMTPKPIQETAAPAQIWQPMTPNHVLQHAAPNQHPLQQMVQYSTSQDHIPVTHHQNSQYGPRSEPNSASGFESTHTRLHSLPRPRVKPYRARPYQMRRPPPQPQPQTRTAPTLQPQAKDTPRPRTPNGTQIVLPATEHTAYLCGLKSGKQVDVPRLARWAAHNWDWAIYLQQGGGNDESWWLYRRMAGYPGFAVSGWKEVYEERARKEEEMRKKARKAEEAWEAEETQKAMEILAAENARIAKLRKAESMKKEKEEKENVVAVQMEERMRKRTKTEVDFTDMMGSFPS